MLKNTRTVLLSLKYEGVASDINRALQSRQFNELARCGLAFTYRLYLTIRTISQEGKGSGQSVTVSGCPGLPQGNNGPVLITKVSG